MTISTEEIRKTITERGLDCVSDVEGLELLARLERAEKELDALRAEVIHIKEVEFPRKAQAVADGWRGKCERLEAKIAEMERQEPVAWCTTDETGTFVEALGMNQSRRFDTALYLAPGAKGEEK